MLLKLIPTNIVAPFLNNDTPQLVILGLVLGAALLLLEDRVANLTTSLRSLQEWSASVMRLAFVLTPVIPFISLFKAFATGNTSVLLDGWEFIVGIFATLVICCLFKLIKVSLRCRLSIKVLHESYLINCRTICAAVLQMNFLSGALADFEPSKMRRRIARQFPNGH